MSNTNLGSVRRIGLKAVTFFMTTTFFAIIIGLLVGNILQPGANSTLNLAAEASNIITPSHSPFQMVLDLLPTNIFASLSEGNVIQVIIIALLIGVATLQAKEKGAPVAKLFKSIVDITMRITTIIIRLAPIGVLGLIAHASSKFGFSVLLPLLGLFGTLLVAASIHVLCIYFPLLKFYGKFSIRRFLSKARVPIAVAFTTGMSSAAFPFSMQAQKELKVKKSIRSLVLSTGMTINMDGTSIYIAIACIFIANLYGITLDTTQYILIVFVGILGSIGTSTVPMSGFFMLAMTIQAIGLPMEALGLIAGIDKILDMTRTCVNVIGDNVCCTTIASTEKEMGFEELTDNSQGNPIIDTVAKNS